LLVTLSLVPILGPRTPFWMAWLGNDYKLVTFSIILQLLCTMDLRISLSQIILQIGQSTFHSLYFEDPVYSLPYIQFHTSYVYLSEGKLV